MRQLITIAFATIMLLTVGIGQRKEKANTPARSASLDTVVINVPTVVCGMCESTITKAVRKVVGVKSVKVDIEKKIATVSFLPAKASLTKLEKTIAAAGYDANSTKRNPEAYEKLAPCCKNDE